MPSTGKGQFRENLEKWEIFLYLLDFCEHLKDWLKYLIFIGGYAPEISRGDESGIGKVKKDKWPYPFHQCSLQSVGLTIGNFDSQ